MSGKDYTVYITDYEMRDLRRWHNERNPKAYTDEQIIATSLHLYWNEKRKNELHNKYFGPSGSMDYASYAREKAIITGQKLNDPMLDELQRMWNIKEGNNSNTDWENGPDDHRLYPNQNKDCKR